MKNYYYIKRNGKVYRYQIAVDEYPLNPREDYDNACKMYIWWNRYILGDDKGKDSPQDILEDLMETYLPEIDYEDMSLNQMQMALNSKASDKVKIYPIYVYEHGGITISMGNGYPYCDRWDGGIGGFMICERETFDEYGTKWERAYDIANGEVDDYDMYLTNSVYEYFEDTYVGDGEWEYDTDHCGSYFSKKWGNDLAKDVLETDTLLTEEEMEKACEEYDRKETEKAEYGLYLMAM